MDSLKKKPPDYTDIAYREAVARLRYLLAESYSPLTSPAKGRHVHHLIRGDESGDDGESVALSERSRHHHHPLPANLYRLPTSYSFRRSVFPDSSAKPLKAQYLPSSSTAATALAPPASESEGTQKQTTETTLPPPELMTFIERQEEYIEQLEKESQFCREELAALLGKVKEVISENEGLHEREKAGLLKSVFDCFEPGEEEEEDRDDQEMDEEEGKVEKPKSQKPKKKRLEGPSIIFESRISELEAQLTQTKMDLRKALEEADTYKKKVLEQQPGGQSLTTDCTTHGKLIDDLRREKSELNDSVSKLQCAINQFREKEAEASIKVKRSLDIVDQAQFEKAQAELEVRRLKDELDRQHEKMREMLQEQGRKVQDERIALERRYTQQMDQLGTDLASQWDAASKLTLDLEKQRRVEAELRRELQQKTSAIEELKKELQNKIVGLQNELMQAGTDKGSLEQELVACRLSIERAERDGRQEVSRLQAEVSALRQRLDRADSDLMHARRENLRLMDQVASLERELNLAKLVKEDSTSSPNKTGSGKREKELSSMIMDMESKHAHTVGELEGMIQSQNQVMEKLKDECHTLTQRLEESSARHKLERSSLRRENSAMLDRLGRLWNIHKQHVLSSNGMTPMQGSLLGKSNMMHKDMMTSSTSIKNSQRDSMTNMGSMDNLKDRINISNRKISMDSPMNNQISQQDNTNTLKTPQGNMDNQLVHKDNMDNPKLHLDSINKVTHMESPKVQLGSTNSSSKVTSMDNLKVQLDNINSKVTSLESQKVHLGSSINKKISLESPKVQLGIISNKMTSLDIPKVQLDSISNRVIPQVSINNQAIPQISTSNQQHPSRVLTSEYHPRSHHLSLSPRRHEVEDTLPPPALRLEDLATDSES